MIKTVIKVTRGGCGIKYTDANGNARHALKTPESGPFECEIEQAKRLVSLGVAAYVAEKVAEIAPQTEKQQEEQADGSQETERASGHLDAEQLEKQLAGMEYNEVKKLAADMGVKPEGKTKADYILAIMAASVEADDEDDGDELPELSAADPE